MGKDALQFVNSISEEDLNRIYKDYEDHKYDGLLKNAHRQITTQQKRTILITYLDYFISQYNPDKEEDLDERVITLMKIVTYRNTGSLVSYIINDQFYQEPLYRLI